MYIYIYNIYHVKIFFNNFYYSLNILLFIKIAYMIILSNLAFFIFILIFQFLKIQSFITFILYIFIFIYIIKK